MTWKGWEEFVPPIRNAPQPPRARTSKYRAQPTTVDNIRFDSRKEANRYVALKILEAAGEIRNLELQPCFVLRAPASWRSEVTYEKVGEYRADFQYMTSRGEKVVEDVKGVRTPLYRWKAKHFSAQYGITILET